MKNFNPKLRTDGESSTYFSRVKVFIDDAVDDAGPIVEEEVGAGLAQAGDQLINSLGSMRENEATRQISLKKFRICSSVLSEVIHSSGVVEK